MIRATLLLLALPLAGLLAQKPPVTFLITAANNAEFRVLALPHDSTLGPVRARGRLELAFNAASLIDANAQPTLEIATSDTLNKVHVDATQNGRVIASGEGAYVLIRRDGTGVAMEVRDHVPASAGRGLRR